MRNIGRVFVSGLALMALLLSTWGSTAFAAGAASPEMAAKAARVRAEMEQRVSNEERQAAADALKALRQKIHTYKVQQADPTNRTKGGGAVSTQGIPGIDYTPIPVAPYTNGLPSVPDYNTTANWAFTPPIAKFVDTVSPLSGVDLLGNCVAPNNLGQCLPVAVPDTVTYPGADYYEIVLRQWQEPMHSDLPNGTPTRGYIQTNDGTPDTLGGYPDAIAGCIAGNTPSDNTCNTVAPPNKGHFLGPIIIAKRDRPVRIKFTNDLPYDVDGSPDPVSGVRTGDLFIPVDESVMGAGPGPSNHTGTRGSVTECNNDDLENNNCEHFAQNRATVHLHGGRTPWISDGTPHQWITPAGENTPYPQGVSVANVPDMPDPGDGSMTFYYSNQQTARLMFYHDHAFGITRLNVLAGMAAGYLITDEFDQDLMARNIIPGNLPGEMIPLVIQDRTFVDATPVVNPYNNNALTPRVRVTDPLWNWGTGGFEADGKTRIPKTGDLWMPHVYMPAQNPFIPDLSGLNPFGRWMYGPWFYPPTQVNHPPINNPYYDPDCSSTVPQVLASCQTPGQPPLIPATPHPSMGMEAFFDSWIVNGTAFPRLDVEPKAYRFRILNAANDRALNMSIYIADETPGNVSPVGTTLPFSGKPTPAGFDNRTEVKVVEASTTNAAAGSWPELWPVDGRAEGVPDPGDCSAGRCTNFGPEIIQIGTDAGFMPAPMVIDPQPVQWNVDPTAFWVGIVQDVGLALMPAERADVIIDFSAYAGKTLILYNDAPAAWPAGVFNYDYWTGSPDYRDSGGYGDGGIFNAVTGLYEGGHGTLPGFAPNTRTVMQIKVAQNVTPGKESPFVMADLEAEFVQGQAPATVAGQGGALVSNPNQDSLFKRAMEPIIVAQSGYDEAYGKTFPSVAPWGGFRYSIDDGHIFTFQTINDEQVSVLMKPKGIHDEMGASFDPEYGRMSGNLAIEIQPPQTNNANLNLYAYSDVPTEFVENSTTVNVQVDQLGQLADGTQIWNVSHNGVDTHPIHFHIFDVQVISRLGWDNQIMLPPANQLGWKDTVRISPLMDTVVAVRPVAPTLPFGLPDSIRPLNPALRIGSEMGFSSVDPVTGQAYVDVTTWAPENAPLYPGAGGPVDTGIAPGVHNVLYNFGWEYVWHCHILSHEEMDMMRAIILKVQTTPPDEAGFDLTPTAGALSWVDPTPVTYTNYPVFLDNLGVLPADDTYEENEIGFNVWKSASGAGAWTKIGSTLANQTTFDDTANYVAGDTYVIEAYNASSTSYSSQLATVTLNVVPAGPYTTAPQSLTLETTIGAPLSANTIDRVEYYDGLTLVATVTGAPVAPYTFAYNDVQGGYHPLTALVVALAPDGSELYAVSSLVPVTIGGGLTVDPFTANGGVAIGPCDAITLTSGAVTGGTAYTYSWLINGVTYAGDNAVVPALPDGVYPTILTVTDTATMQVQTVSQDVTVTATKPTVITGGPYTVDSGGLVTLAGSGTTVDTCNEPLSIAWNIDSSVANNLTYDYFTNRTLPYSLLAGWLGVGTHDITLKVTDASGLSDTLTVPLTINGVPYSITTTALPAGTAGAAYNVQLTATGAAGATTWKIFGLPLGLSYAPATGIISGTPDPTNVRAGSNFATFPVYIYNIDTTGSASLQTTLSLRINK